MPVDPSSQQLTWLAALRGREAVLWPDADAAGVRHMERVAAALAGVAFSVTIYSPKGLLAGVDAAEWIERRRTVAIWAVATALDRGAETPPGGRAEASLSGLAAAAGAAAIGDSLRQLGEALRGADPLTRGLAGCSVRTPTDLGRLRTLSDSRALPRSLPVAAQALPRGQLAPR
jgi:hypothetical protein